MTNKREITLRFLIIIQPIINWNYCEFDLKSMRTHTCDLHQKISFSKAPHLKLKDPSSFCFWCTIYKQVTDAHLVLEAHGIRVIILGQTGFFSLGEATSLGEGKL